MELPYSQELYIENVEERAEERLLSGVGGNVQAFAKAFGLIVQLSEDDVFDLYSTLPIESASGAILDRWGAIVGESRLGLDDNDYKAFIRARIAALFTASRRSRIVAVLASLYDTVEASYSQYIAAFRVNIEYTEDKSASFDRRVGRLLEVMRPAGVDATIAVGEIGVWRLGVSELGFNNQLGRRL